MVNPNDYTEAQTFTVGDRVEIHPRFDAWMRGAKYGDIIKVYGVNGSIIRVKLDRMRKAFHCGIADLRHV